MVDPLVVAPGDSREPARSSLPAAQIVAQARSAVGEDQSVAAARSAVAADPSVAAADWQADWRVPEELVAERV